MAKIIQLRRTSEIGCSSCGATVDAACDCGAPYMPAGQRAAEAIAANPLMSDRALAREIGVDHKTVGTARRTGEHSPVENETRIGLDGKERRMPVRRPGEDDGEHEFSRKELSDRNRGSFLLRAQEARNFAFYSGKVDGKLLEFARGTAAAWCELVKTLENQL
jgi:hypothetical protein